MDSIEDVSIMNKIGLISLSFRNFTEWNGKGRPIQEDLEKNTEIIEIAHEFGKPFRFWTMRDSKIVWKAMVDLGVDYVNTGYPFECVAYVNSLPKRSFVNSSFSVIYKPIFLSDGSSENLKNIILLIGDGNILLPISFVSVFYL